MSNAIHGQGLPSYVELTVDDVPAAVNFYCELLGWTAQPDPGTDSYFTMLNDGQQVAGITTKMNPHQPTAWFTYFEADDIKAAIADIAANGGATYLPPTPVPGEDNALFTFANDPAGAPFGVTQGGKMFEAFGDPGDLVWFELESTKDAVETAAFYQRVFGWQTQQMPANPEMSYVTFMRPGSPAVGGVFSSPEFPAYLNHQSQWAVTFAVADVAATVAKAKELGATIEGQHLGTEYGDLAMLRDPQGAFFVLMKPVPIN